MPPKSDRYCLWLTLPRGQLRQKWTDFTIFFPKIVSIRGTYTIHFSQDEIIPLLIYSIGTYIKKCINSVQKTAPLFITALLSFCFFFWMFAMLALVMNKRCNFPSTAGNILYVRLRKWNEKSSLLRQSLIMWCRGVDSGPVCSCPPA